MPETHSPDSQSPDTAGSTQILPVLATTSGVIGPHMVVTVAVETADARTALADARRNDGRVLVVPRRGDGRYGRVGTIAKVEQDGKLPNGERAVVLRGVQRAVLGAGIGGRGEGLWVEAEPVVATDVSSPELDRLVAEYRTVVEAILEHRGARSLAESIAGLHDPNAVADLALYSPDLDFDQKVEVLETVEVAARLRLVLGWARDTLAELSVRDELRRNLEDQLGKEQREAVLRRQLAAIQAELGEEGDGDALDGYRAKLAELAAAGVDATITDAIAKELDKLARTPAQNPEHGWIVGWLDTVFALPWTVRAERPIDLDEARRILDADHDGLEKVKTRLIEHLAVRKLRQERSAPGPDGGDGGDNGDGRTDRTGRSGRARSAAEGSILLLVGPPGVGKTSLGESVARALGRPFARVSLGGVRDEAEIRGHRRTYVGARAGRFVRALTEAGAMNPVLLLDEVDKVGNDWRGDPSSALLEVLDPAQNHTFRDHYLELDLDLSDVVFIATANQLDAIAGPLADRLEIIALEGYVDEEKVAIARHHLLGRLGASLGLRNGEIVLTDDAIRHVISGYTREAGVRELERQLAAVLRKLVARLDEAPLVVGPQEVGELLGRARFRDEVAERTSVPGVATGLAVTGVGGGVLSIEAAAMDAGAGGAGLTLTGQLGDVMKESAEIARSYVRSHRAELGVDGRIDDARLHLHVPAGATPKDGPSAGITMTTALVSLLSGRPVRADVAMTGEVTLTGRVLPIGGVRQKVLAAQRAGITTVILPKGNEADLDDVPAAVREALSIHLVGDVAEVLAVALAPADEAAPAA